MFDVVPKISKEEIEEMLAESEGCITTAAERYEYHPTDLMTNIIRKSIDIREFVPSNLEITDDEEGVSKAIKMAGGNLSLAAKVAGFSSSRMKDRAKRFKVKFPKARGLSDDDIYRVDKALQDANGSIDYAAKILGISREAVAYYRQRYDLKPKEEYVDHDGIREIQESGMKFYNPIHWYGSV